MNEKTLEETIRDLNDSQGANIPKRVLADDFFIEQPAYRDLKKIFVASKYHQHSWKWHQVVRIVLEPAENRYYMYDRLLSLILKHRRSYNDYFQLVTVEGTYHVPNPLADLNRLEILVRQYFEIYRDITKQIHFNILKSEHSGAMVRGKINWHKTIRNSSTEFPLIFVTTVRETEFVTPENILLVLCAVWMHRESSRLLHTEFIQPLSEYSKSILSHIIEISKLVLTQFPFNEVLYSSRKFWSLSYDDERVKSLEREAFQRLKQGLVHNINYSNLLIWIERFRKLNISHVSSTTPTRHILESLENLDTGMRHGFLWSLSIMFIRKETL